VTRLVARSLEVESERLGFRLDGGIQHLLLDEFQDTSLAQWEVLRRFAREVTSATDGSSFFCVGDVKQAIYGWRGGLAEIFNALDDELTSLERSELVKSYRSTQPVIDTVNTIFQKLHTHPNLGDHEEVVREWQTRFSPHTTAIVDQPGYACLRVLPTFDDADDADAERDDFVAQYIIDQMHAAPGVEIGVLVRSNRLVRRLIFALRAKGVEASEEGGNPLVDSAAVNLILSLLRIADHPGDTVSRYHVARSPLGQALGFTNLADEDAAARLSAQTRRELIDEGYGPVILRWAKLLAPSCNRREMSRLDQLVELAYRYDPNGSIRADHFIAMVEEAKVSDPTSAPVRVMTVHQAKGLEFGIVILPELDTKLVGENAAFVTGRPSPTEHATAVCRYVEKAYWPFLPDEFQKMFRDENDQRVSEALCVLYVELTRPVHALHMLIDADSASSTTVHRTPAGFLKASLCESRPLAADSIAYECGDADWYLQLVSPPAPRALPAPAQRFEIHLAADGATRERGWQSVSPSQLEGGPTLRIAEVFRPARSGGQEFGTLMHAWLSRIEWLEQGLPKDELLERIAVEEVGWGRDTSAERRQFYQYLERPEIKDILTQKSFKQDLLVKCDELMVENERRFALRQSGQLVNGSIDRIVLYLKAGQVIAADVLDYKTDALPPGDAAKLAEKVEFYRPQLAAYVSSVQQMYGLAAAQCRSRLVFLGTGDIVTLEDRATHEVPARRRHPHRQPTQRMLF
jgi:ATP-dependent exoDNAse (exonuclease V) beta subunit